MEKFAFIVMMPNLDPEHYRADFETDRDLNTYIGVDNLDQAEEVIGRLTKLQDYTLINLCGAFDADSADRMARAAAPGTAISYVTFTGDEERKLNAADDWGRFGLLIHDDWIGQTQAQEVPGDFHTSIRYVNSLSDAMAAAKELVRIGCTFIEMCSWFDEDRTNAITATLKTEVPVGTAGRNRIVVE